MHCVSCLSSCIHKPLTRPRPPKLMKINSCRAGKRLCYGICNDLCFIAVQWKQASVLRKPVLHMLRPRSWTQCCYGVTPALVTAGWSTLQQMMYVRPGSSCMRLSLLMYLSRYAHTDCPRSLIMWPKITSRHGNGMPGFGYPNSCGYAPFLQHVSQM